MGAAFLLVAVAGFAWLIVGFNRLVRLKNQVENGWRQIDVQLKRRHDLIPGLVDAVRGALEFEQDTLEKVAAARNTAVAARGMAATADAENALTQALRQLAAVVEAYPELRGTQNVLQLQEELTTTENQIGFARQHYNDVTMRFNTQQEVFPSNIIARFFGFAPADLFSATIEDRTVPSVQLSLRPES